MKIVDSYNINYINLKIILTNLDVSDHGVDEVCELCGRVLDEPLIRTLDADVIPLAFVAVVPDVLQ